MNKSNKIDKKPFKLRAVQLDLARQIESIEYIKSFIDFIDQYDYNCLVLYLEGRIKTESFPYRKDSESYSKKNIQTVVSYAALKSIEVIPVISLFGHAEQFVSCPELEELAELRGDKMGRFSKFKHVFCPSQETLYDFFASYLAEIADLFPSKYFHAGFDEAWDIAYCDECNKRLENETQADIFSKHLDKCYDIVVNKLNKKMIVWDDMFDIYPSVLKNMPRDIILCAWHYEAFIEKPAGHCGGPQNDKFKLYDKLGLEYWFSPAIYSLRNILSFTDYAINSKASAALLTSWELKRDFMFSYYPCIAVGGKLWNQDLINTKNTDLIDATIHKVTGCVELEHISLIKHIINSPNITLLDKYQAYLRGQLTNEEYERKLFNGTALNILQPYFQSLEKTSISYPVIEDIVIRLELESLYFDLREFITAWFALKGDNRITGETECLIQKILRLKEKRRHQWKQYRNGIVPCNSDIYFDKLIEMINKASKDSLKVKAVLKVRFKISYSKIKFLVKHHGAEKWEEFFSSPPRVRAHFANSQQVNWPIYFEQEPEKIRIESCGYTGSGIAYVEYETKKKTYVPKEIINIVGNIYSPESVLENGKDFCFMGDGEQKARRKFCNPQMSKKINSFEIILKKKDK